MEHYFIKRELGERPTKYINNLEYAVKYIICAQLGVHSTGNKCSTMCSKNSYGQCKEVSTNCEFLPAPTKTPKAIEWTHDNKFDPFTEIMFEMEIGTFAGETSGLHQFMIRFIHLFTHICFFFFWGGDSLLDAVLLYPTLRPCLLSYLPCIL